MHRSRTFFNISLIGFAFPIFLVLVSATPTGFASAGEASAIRSVQVGIESFYKSGLWTPITVRWTSPKPLEERHFALTIDCTDSDGTPISYRYDLVEVVVERKNGEETVCRGIVYAKLGIRNGPMTVTLEQESRLVDRKRIVPAGDPIRLQKSTASEPFRFCEPISTERPIYLIIGNEDIGLQGAVAELALREERRPILVKVKSVAELPDRWFGYEAIDMVVLTTTEPGLFDGLTSTSPCIRALDDWIRLGGRLFFSAGKDAGPFLETEEGVLNPFLPGKYERMTDLRDGSPLEIFVGSKRQIFMNGTEEAPFLQMPRLSNSRGISFVKDGDSPLILRCAHGFGTITYFGGDLSGKPLASWRDRVELVRNIMQWNTERQTSGRGNVSLIQLGYNDISGQIRSALDGFEGVRIIPFSVILLILAAYWLLVGPADWFLVHKILKRPFLTWLTFPLWILLFCSLAYMLAAAGRPNRVMLNELTLVDKDEETGMLRTTSWGNLYSPNDSRFDLSLRTEFGGTIDSVSALFSWNGLPGSGLGGMAPKTVRPTVWQSGSLQRFPTSNDKLSEQISGVPIQIRSTKSFFGQGWLLEEREAAPGFRSELTDEEGIPIGSLTSSETMPVLEQCVLIYGRWMQQLGTMEPGRKVTVGKGTPRNELRDLLIPQVVLDEEKLQQYRSYNTQSTDLEYIVRVFSLHGLLGGFESIGLHNAFQRSLDMSDLFAVDRAVLIGVVQSPGSKRFGSSIHLPQGESRRTVAFRQSMPIKLTPLSPRLKIERVVLMKDDLQERDKTIQGPDQYKVEDPGKK